MAMGEISIMTNSTRLLGLIMTAALWTGVAFGQGMTPDSGDDLPPDLTLPSNGASLPPPVTETLPPAEGAASSERAGQVATESLDGYLGGDGCEPYHPNLGGFWTELAPIESTGTWLRRGFWYVESDAVILNRMWSRDDRRFAAEDPNVIVGPQFNPNPAAQNSLGFNPFFLNTNRILIVNGALPGRDAAVRGTLGNFLFRDDHNRDHTVEFTAMGGGEWEQDRTMSSVDPQGLFVPFAVAGNNETFNASSRQRINYASNLKSFELNYHVRARLSHDQLIMDPNGNWHRAANAGFQREYIAGLRFMELAERFDWTAEDIVNVGDDGSYLINSDNDLFGFQLGTGMAYQAPRFSLGVTVKGGVFLNDVSNTSVLNFTANDDNDANLRMRENQLSFVGEFRLLGRYHLLPNASLRAGYEMLFITSTAMAPLQATFTTDTTYVNTTGDPFYHGASFGFEMYW
jgi:hypothetical protein